MQALFGLFKQRSEHLKFTAERAVPWQFCAVKVLVGIEFADSLRACGGG